MNPSAWKAWVVPGGLILALAAAIVSGPLLAQVASSLPFYYVGGFAVGLLLAWRFHSSRLLFSLLVLLLAHRAVDFFSSSDPRTGALLASAVHHGPGRTAVALAALLIPLNFIAFAAMRERGLTMAGIAPRCGLLFVESVAFAILCRPENDLAGPRTHAGAHSVPTVPLWMLSGFIVALAFFIRRFFQTRKPVEPGFVWSVAAVFLWLEFAPVGKAADAYVATTALILAASLIETSYVLAYHDELTGIRGRRAFNESLLSLDREYAIAIVDIDHFKTFNDTYGHDVGDQVLCMVAKRLTEVGGGGEAFRCGGEEFAIVFRGSSAKEAFDHLETLRRSIEASSFHQRGAERREARRGGAAHEKSTPTAMDRRNKLAKSPDTGPSERRRSPRRKAVVPIVPQSQDRLSVTVSMGVAEPGARNRQPERVIQAADQALYSAKRKGRNRVEVATPATPGLALVRSEAKGQVDGKVKGEKFKAPNLKASKKRRSGGSDAS